MTEEDKKELLIKDLCSRYPYITIVRVWDRKGPKYNRQFDIDLLHDIECNRIAIAQPYLFPLTSMTKEQVEEFNKLNKSLEVDVEDKYHIRNKVKTYLISDGTYNVETSLKDYMICINWLNKNHFDYRYLIKKGLALNATGLNIYK